MKKVIIPLAEFPVDGWTPSYNGVFRAMDSDGTELGACSLNEDDVVTYTLSCGGNVSNRRIPINSPPPVCVNHEVRFQPRGIPSFFEFEPNGR